MPKTTSLKLRQSIFFLFFLCFIGCMKYNASAATVRVLSVNGGDTNDENSFLYSASLFNDCIDTFYINGIKVNESDCHYRKDPSYSALDKAIDSIFSDSKGGDISVLYYSGHGTMSDNGHAGIYTSDGNNYEFSHLYSKLKRIKGKKLVILDCCYSGSFITQNAIDKTNFSVLTACEHNSYSPFFNKLNILTILNGKKLTLTHFSDKILDGFGYYDGSLKADADKNKIITINELFRYLQQKYQKTYSAVYNNEKIKFKAVPQKYGNANFIFSKTATSSTVNGSSIKINKSKVTLYTSGNKTVLLKATVKGTSKKVTWKSSKPSVVSVNSKGKVTAKKVGTATITAKVNGVSASCIVTVKKPSIKLNKSKATIYISGNSTLQLKATVKGSGSKVAWTSSNKKIATVSSKGKVTAKKAGTVSVTAKVNGVTAKCLVTVKDVPAGKVMRVEMKLNYNASSRKMFYDIKGIDRSGKTVWSYKSGGYTPTELQAVAFEEFGQYVYVMEVEYFIKLSKSTGEVLIKEKVCDPAYGATMFIDTSGNLYVIHYYSDVLYKISPYGKLLWRDTIKTDLYWPYKMEISNGKLLITYDGGGGGTIAHAL